jgi:hypothetical protein
MPMAEERTEAKVNHLIAYISFMLSFLDNQEFNNLITLKNGRTEVKQELTVCISMLSQNLL